MSITQECKISRNFEAMGGTFYFWGGGGWEGWKFWGN